MHIFTVGLLLVLAFVQASAAVSSYQPSPSCLRSSRFKIIVIFGDSTADTGNVFRLTHYTYPPPPYYYKGRYCNGPNWVDQLDVSGLVVKNYAYGGSTTDNNLIQGYTGGQVPVPGMLQQVQLYLKENPVKKINFDNTLYVFYGGSNDFIYNNSLTPAVIIPSMLKGLILLLNNGAKHGIVFYQPPAQYFPYTRPFNNPTEFTELIYDANLILNKSMKALQSKYSKASLDIFDLYKVVLNWVSRPSSYFTDTTDGCQTIINATTAVRFCKDPNRYVFVDEYHFTNSAQGLLADAFRPYLYDSYEVNNAVCYVLPARYIS